MPSAFRRACTGTTPLSGPAALASNGRITEFPSPSPVPTSSRRATVMAQCKGVKPWQGGTYLTSVGLNDLDTILGGGQPLGTCMLVQEDRWTTDLAISLVRYWCAEALSQEQHLIVPCLEATANDDYNGFNENNGPLPPWNASTNQLLELNELLLGLPFNLHWDKHRKRQEGIARGEVGVGSSSHNPMPLDALVEGNEEEEVDDEVDDMVHENDDGLVVAWQYKSSVQKERLATGIATLFSSSSSGSNSIGNRTVFCHSYDLSGRMADQIPIDPSNNVVTLPSSSLCTDATNKSIVALGRDLFCDLVKLVKEKASMASSSSQQGTATRLLLYHIRPDVLAVALPLLVAYVRNESLPMVIMVYTTPLSSSDDNVSWIALARICDIVLRTEGFASRREYPPPLEFRHLQGILHVDKTTRKHTEVAARIYGFKRDRRKLHVPLLHIPPEEYADGGGSVGAGGVRSGAGRPASDATTQGATTQLPSKTKTSGMGCSSNGSGSALDF